mgnify:CR=1 FL=1
MAAAGLGIRTDSRIVPAYVDIERRQQDQVVVPEVELRQAEPFDGGLHGGRPQGPTYQVTQLAAQ